MQQRVPLPQRTAGFFKEVRAEMKKVIWLGWRQTAVFTGVVLLSVLVVGVTIWIADVAFGELITYLTK
ncbi:MAG: preprotein translocase subunit SecE [Thermaerobacter sp.]|jgi:preprotein translocase subunit SecE|nr:preprotein translocase subunit SecE [Thermaerobacter sp.]MDA8144589.1 preprotein translocase subunit SecE [Thermaerobacter sp.]